MEHTLVLNASYEPINIVSWKRALTLLYQGKVEVLAEYDREIRSISSSAPVSARMAASRSLTGRTWRSGGSAAGRWTAATPPPRAARP